MRTQRVFKLNVQTQREKIVFYSFGLPLHEVPYIHLPGCAAISETPCILNDFTLYYSFAIKFTEFARIVQLLLRPPVYPCAITGLTDHDDVVALK